MNKRTAGAVVATVAFLVMVSWLATVSWFDVHSDAVGAQASHDASCNVLDAGAPGAPAASHAELERVARESADTSGRIRLSVVDGVGRPIGGAAVSLAVEYADGQEAPSHVAGVTGSDGTWVCECAHRAVESVLVVARHSSFSRSTHRFRGSQVEWRERSIALGPVVLEVGCQLDGCVADGVGRSLQIQAAGADISPVELVWGRDGSFWSADRISPGRYRLRLDGVVSGKAVPEEIVIPPGTLSYHVDVRSSSQDRGPADAISGIIVDDRGAPVSGCVVVAQAHGFHAGVSDSEGRFVVQRDDDPSSCARLCVDSFHDGQLRFAYRPWVGVRSYAWGESNTVIELAAACSVRLHVYVDDRRLSAYEYRVFQRAGGAEARLMSATDDGRGVLVAGVRPGKNQVVVIPPGSLGATPWMETVDVVGIQQDCHLRFDVPSGLRVKVEDQEGNGLPGAMLEVLDLSCVTAADSLRLEAVSPSVMFELGYGLPVRVATGVSAKDGTWDMPRCAGDDLVVRASWRGRVAWRKLQKEGREPLREIAIVVPTGGGCALSIDLGELPAKDPRWDFFGVRLVGLDPAEGGPRFLPWNGEGVLPLGEGGQVRFDACRAGSYAIWLFGGKATGQWTGLPPALGKVEIRDGVVAEMRLSVAFTSGALRVVPDAAFEGPWRVFAKATHADSGDPPTGDRIALGRDGEAVIEGMHAGRYRVLLYMGGCRIDCGEVEIVADRWTTLVPELGRKLRITAENNGRPIGGGTPCKVLDVASGNLVYEGYTDGDGAIAVFVNPRMQALTVVAGMRNGEQEMRGDVTLVGDVKDSLEVALR